MSAPILLGLGLALLASPRALAEPPRQVDAINLETLIVQPPVEPGPRTPKEDIRRLLRPEASILEARNRLDQDILRREADLARARGLQARVSADLAETTTRFGALTEALEAERRLVRTRLLALDRSLRTGALADLVNARPTPTGATSWSRFESRRNARALIEEADRRRLASYAQQLATWRSKSLDLERRTKNLEHLTGSIAFLERELAWDREEREALQQAVVNEPEFYATYAREIEAIDGVITSKIKEVLAKAPSDRPRLYVEETRGGLAWPIRNADVVGSFGPRIYKGIRSIWRGAHLIPLRPPAKGPTEVRSIYWGYVAWTGWMQGLGQVVLVDHTMGYVSLYAHLAAIEVEVGLKVASGDVLGAMGDTESYFGPRLYLELRKDGVAIEPIAWLKR